MAIDVNIVLQSNAQEWFVTASSNITGYLLKVSPCGLTVVNIRNA